MFQKIFKKIIWQMYVNNSTLLVVFGVNSPSILHLGFGLGHGSPCPKPNGKVLNTWLIYAADYL
jgi:hypothetical protein